MPPEVWSILACLLGLATGSSAAFILLRRQERNNLNSSQHRAAELIAHAHKEAENLKKSAVVSGTELYGASPLSFFQKSRFIPPAGLPELSQDWTAPIVR